MIAGPVSAWAPGKLILVGEHAVVYGHPAIAAAVSLGTTVTLRPVDGPSRLGETTLRDTRLWPALAPLLPAEGVAVDIRTDLPVGAGMGSSAALAVALVRALALAGGETLDPATAHARAFPVERAFHGNPSGIDHAVCRLGGLAWYRRTGDGPSPDDERPGALRLPGAVVAPLHPAAPLHLAVLDTGAPGNTAEMVAGVRARGCRAELDAIGALVGEVERLLTAGTLDLPELGRRLDENHHLLQAIGVSTPALDDACRALRRAGAYGAKLAGAGGGGVAFGLVPPGLVVEGARAVVVGAPCPA